MSHGGGGISSGGGGVGHSIGDHTGGQVGGGGHHRGAHNGADGFGGTPAGFPVFGSKKSKEERLPRPWKYWIRDLFKV